MKDLYTSLTENLNNPYNNQFDQVDEGLFKSSMGFFYIKKMNSQYLLNGLLNMYEYIVEKSDIKLFYNDFPVKERPFWTNIYNLYKNGIWSIFDAPKPKGSDTQQDQDDLEDTEYELNKLKEDPEKNRIEIRQLERKIRSYKENIYDKSQDNVEDCFPEKNTLIDVTPEFRRKLRHIIQQSSVTDSNLNANNVMKIMLIDDPQFDKRYIFTINKIMGVVRRLFKAVDVKMLEKMFEKISSGE